MGYVIGFGACFLCTRPFSFNPSKVPSVKGKPICRACMASVNQARQKIGQPAFEIPADAYEPCPEEELP
jgi:hypothetical protein